MIFDSDEPAEGSREARRRRHPARGTGRGGGARTAPRSPPRPRRPGNGRRSRDAVLLRARLRRVARDEQSHDAPVRRHPLGRHEPARPPRSARGACPRRPGHVRRARAPRAAWRAADLGRRPACVHGPPARPAHRRLQPGARRTGSWPRRPWREAASKVAEMAEGNPLFIEELAASIAERSTSDELPTSVRGIIAARLDSLPPDERSILVDASVAGRVFWRGALAEMAHAPGPRGHASARSRIAGSSRARPCHGSRETSSIAFKHSLIQDVAYQTLPRAARRERHAAVARFLSSATADRPVTRGARASLARGGRAGAGRRRARRRGGARRARLGQGSRRSPSTRRRSSSSATTRSGGGRFASGRRLSHKPSRTSSRTTWDVRREPS